MNPKKTIAVAIALIAMAVVAVRLTKPSSPLLGGRPATAGSYANTPRNLPADAVLAIAPGSGATAGHRPVSVLSPVLTEFAHAKSYKSLYDRLRPASSRTPEETWILATILKECGKQPNRKQDDASASIPDDVAVSRFAAALPARDPAREKRIAAFRGVRGGRCGDLKDLQTTPEAIRDLLAQAAAAGDPKAAADLVHHDLWAPLDAMNAGDRFSMATAPWPAISAGQIAELKRAAESGDPFALVSVAQAFGGPFTNMNLQDAQDRPVNSGDLRTAAQLVACDAGYPCGPDSRSMQFGCAYFGNCDAQTLREYAFFYGLSPDASQRVAQYEAMLTRAVRDHDWSSFTFHPGPAVILAPYVKPQ